MLGEGLEVLGTTEYTSHGEPSSGVFEESALESIVLPKTLKRIEHRTFKDCKNLKNIDLPEGLRYIGAECFSGCGINYVTIPAALRSAGANVFLGSLLR